MEKNFLRMIQLADECFGNFQDPTQLAVDEEVRARLGRLHAATMAEEKTLDGPIAWTLVIPTTLDLMEAFLAESITEQGLYEATPEGAPYQAVYLCSALVLPEHRRQGIAQRLIRESLQAICAEHPIQALFYWSFSEVGESLAQRLAKEFSLPLRCRPRSTQL